MLRLPNSAVGRLIIHWKIIQIEILFPKTKMVKTNNEREKERERDEE